MGLQKWRNISLGVSCACLNELGDAILLVICLVSSRLLFYSSAITCSTKAVPPNRTAIQALKTWYYFFPDHVKLLVQSIIKERYCISTVSYIPMQITPVSQHKCETDLWRMQSLRNEADRAHTLPNHRALRTKIPDPQNRYGDVSVPSAIRIVLVGSLLTSILISSTASHSLATLPNVQMTNLKY